MRGLVVCVALACACADGREARDAVVVNAIVDVELPILRTRPVLAADKLAAMAADPIDFHRGSIALWARDWRSGRRGAAASSFGVGGRVLAVGLGDPHPGNFGVLRASDGTLALEPNDLDAADRVPALWDLRRFTVGLVLWARAGGLDDAAARDVVWQAVFAYADGGGARVTGGEDPILDELFDDAAKDWEAHEELETLTTVDEDTGERRFVRGVPDPDAPGDGLADLVPTARGALPAALDAYRTTLLAPVAPETFAVLDAVRIFGRGVASRARVRLLVLVRGASDAPDDDVILELKEVGAGGAATTIVPPGVSSDDEAVRIVAAARRLWARADGEPRLGSTHLLGLPVLVRQEARGNKGLGPSRLLDVDEAERAGALTQLARVLARIVARAHDGDPAALVVDGDDARRAFADEEADLALVLADGVDADRQALADALAELGPTLGIAPSPPGDVPADVRALIGTPPPLPLPLDSP